MSIDKEELEERARLVSERRKLVIELDGGLSATGIRNRKRARNRRSLTWVVAQRATTILRRVADVVLAGLVMVLLSPLLLLASVAAGLSGGGLVTEMRLGRWATHFKLYQNRFPAGSRLAKSSFLQSLPALYNVFKGEMSFIGPRPIAPGEEFTEKRLAWKRYHLRPGLFSLWWIRKRANIAYSSEVSLDLEYVETKSFWGDVGIAARAVPSLLYSSGVSNAPVEIRFLGIRIDNLTMAEASVRITELAQAGDAAQVCFVNADCVNIACEDADYLRTLSQAKLVLADGIGVRLAGSILDQNVRENVNGTDMLPYLCKAAEEAKLGLYLLGGKPGVADAAAKWVAEHYPELRIAGVHHGYFSPEEEAGLLQKINGSNASIVLVALGTPTQDKWIAKHKEELSAKVMIGVGGLLDFYSGRIPRAPAWVRELGMEWFYRFMQEPRRMWRRYFVGNVTFLYRVVRERMRYRAAHRMEDGAQ